MAVKKEFECCLIENPRVVGYVKDGKPIVRVLVRVIESDTVYPVTGFRGIAESMIEHLRKGDTVRVWGELRKSNFIDKNSGTERRGIEIVADDIEFVGGGE